jgi:glycosyltransferase involved in cell wall biosynthesis
MNDEPKTPGKPVLLTVSGNIPNDLHAAISSGDRPRADYLEMSKAFDADLLDYASADARRGRFGRLLTRIVGRNVALAWSVFSLRKQYQVVVTDGEQVGLPLAAFMRLFGRRPRFRHMMIVHIMSFRKKELPFRLLRLGGRIDELIVYCSAQEEFVVRRLGVPAEHVTSSRFMVDTAFFDPHRVTPVDRSPMICSAGLEFRDYPTMIEAVRGLDVRVVLAAASPWSTRRSELDAMNLPPNVEVVQLDLHQLRQLYADASIVVVPLRETDFQAGVTTLLEAMAMAKAIVCSRTTGQTDVVVDDETGLYVPVGDVGAMRAVIARLLAEPETAQRLGTAARAWVVANADIDVYVAQLAERVDILRGRVESASSQAESS